VSGSARRGHRPSRLVRLAAAAAASVFVAASPPAPAEITAIAGAWDLALDGSHRRCRIVLGIEAAGIGRVLRFPAGCRRALPILAQAGGWLVPAKGTLRIVDAAGQPALDFAAGPVAGTFQASTGSGETYLLEPSDKPVRVARAPPAPALGVPQPTPVDPAKAPPPASLPGVYAVDRYTERDVCRIALGGAMLNADGRFEARVVEGCRDAGLAVFDPVAWRYEAGRLTLFARRGHEVTLIPERDGLWRRDPEIGTTLKLRKAE
jgi:hypothetical protein